MIELHGWLTIVDTYADEDLLSENEIKQIRQKVEMILANNTCGLKIQHANGETFLNTLFCANHRTTEVDEIIKIYTMVSETASGSYGVLYIRDDEDKNYSNEFQIYLFKRGKMEYKIDTDFSPCIPALEDDVFGVFGS